MRKSKSPLPLSLPSPKMSAGLPAKSGGRGKALHARSAEDIPKAVRAAGGKDVGAAGSKSRGSSPATISVPQAGIRYITEGLIKKIAKEENLEQITSLNLMLSKEGGKKIKYIENLEKLKRLQTLNLSCNVIEKIEKLDRLSKLRELNLSFNSISRLDGLESLVNLHSLNVTGNVIENIPPWFSKKLKALRVFRIAKNRLATLSECIKLKVLPDLVQFSTADNPVADLPHARPYLVFHLRSLESLDGVTVTEEDRQEAQTRFEQEEVEQLERQLEAGETRYRKLEHDHNKSVHELQQKELTEQEHKKRASLHQDKIQDLERELNTKNDLLRKKTVELTKACEKHYQLEQELAFYKIDSKFETLGHRPETTDLDDSGNLDESPYIGRARYKANQLAQEGSMVASPQQARLHQSDTAVASNLSLHPDVRDEMNRTLDREIADKQKAINRAKSELERLQSQLGNTEEQVLAAAKELKRVRDLTPYTEHTEQHKQKLRQALAKKMRHVNELRDAAAQVEDDMGRVQADAQQTQTDLSDLRGRLQGMDSNHPHYRKTYREMVDKEQQISESSQLFAKLQQQLEAMLETIAKETSEIRQMEQKLNEDQISQNEDLREELGGIVGGLQTYLQSMKSQSKQQQQELQELLSQREALEDKLRMMENDLSVRDTETADYLEMKSRLAELEESLQEHQDQNELLQEQLQSFHQDPEITDRIESAETEIKGLRKALRDAQKKAESDRVTMEKELDAERARAQEALRNLPAQSQQEGAIKRLSQQLEAVKALNESLQDEMEDQQQKLQQQLNETIPPEELRQRLGHLASIITKGRALIQPDGRDDFVGETFRHIQKVVQEKMNTSQKDAERLKQEKSRLDGEVQTLRQKMNTLQGQGSDAEAKVQRDKYLAKLEAARKKDADQIRKLEEEMNKLGKALRDAHAKSKQTGMGTQTAGQTQMVYDLEQGTETEGDSLNTEERDLLDELQRELMELRNVMHNKEIEQAKQMADAEADAATRDNDFRQQQAMFQKDMERQRKELELERQRQDARARVLDGDLSQARNEADALQRMLEEKTHNLTAPGSNMTNEMIAAQEEEIAHLYDILERQRGEIDRLNRALHHVTDQGPEGYGPGYEEEMSRLRGEVTRLKETLAMQSQYVQSMSPQPDNRPRPPGVSMGTQSQFRPPVQPVPSLRQPIPQPPYQYQQSVNQVRPRSQQPHPLYPQPIIPTQSASQGHVPGHHGDYGGEDIPDGLTNQRIAERTDQPMKEPRTPFEGSARSRIQTLPQPGTAGHQGHPHRLPEAGDAPLHSTPTNERDHPGNKDRADGGGSQFVDHLETRTPWGRYGGTTRGPTTFTDRRENKSRSPPRSRVRPDQPEVPGHDVEARAPYVPPAQPTRVYSAPYRPPGTNIREDGEENADFSPLAMGPFTGIAENVNYNSAPENGEIYDYPGPFETVAPAEEGMWGWTAPLAPGGRGSHLHPTPEVSPIRPLAVHSRQIRPSGAESGMPRAANPTSHSQVMPPPQAVMPHSSTQYVHVPPSGQPVPPTAYPMPPPHVPQQPVPHATHPVPHPQSRSLQGHPLPVHSAPHGAPAPSSGRVSVTPGSVHHGAIPGVIAPEGPGQPMYIPVTPVYTSPLNDAVTQTNAPATTNQPGTVFLPISPIRPTNGKMERAPTRGILKKSDEEEGDESYLYCNVPEHHELEDHIASLQEKIKELKLLLKKGKFHKGSVSDIEETRLIRRLIAELEERRVDLEGLDLAIERQKKDMRRMKREERSLVLDKSTADEELNVLKVKNKRMEKRNKYLAQFDSDSDDDFDYRAAKKQQKHLTNEIECLQKTLLKRRAELRDTERQLKQCSDNLRDARGQARDTVRQYDQASVGLQNTVRDAVEIEKRANDAGVELIKVSDQLATLKSEVRELDRKKSQQDRLLKEINQIIAKKDKEFREMETRSKQATINCQRITAELAASEHREKEVTATLRESEDVLGSRRTELNRLREQIENQRSELEKVDQQMGRRKTELRMLEETLGRKQSELNAVLRDAETEVSSKQRELKEHWEQAKTLESQNTDLTSSVKVKRAELHQLRSDIDEENEALEKILGAVSKQKSELKHTFEMQKLEQTELESLKSQHNQKLAELEKTQAALLDERAELERLTTETNRKTGELERLRQSLDRERAELDRVAMEKRGLEERITTLSRDKELLEENSKSVDNRLNQMKRAVGGLEDRLEVGTRRVEQLDEESKHRETEVEQLNAQRALLQKDVTSLKNIIDNGRGELKDLKDQVSDAQDHAHNLEQDLRDTKNQRDSLLREIEELESAVRESRISHELCVEHESEKKKELQEVLQNLEIHRAEFEEVLRLVSSTNSELSHIQSAVAGKEEELTLIINNINKLKNEAETRVMTGEKFTEMEKEIRELRRDLVERNREKNELSYALTRSYEEVQKLRSESAQEREKLIADQLHLEALVKELKHQLDHTQQELVDQQRKTESQVVELESLAQEHIRRANQLNRDIGGKGGHDDPKKQGYSRNGDLLEEHLNILLMDRLEGRQLPLENKENAVRDVTDGPVLDEWKREALKDKLIQEQDYLRQQLRQQMSRHSEAMESVRLQSEGTLDSLRRKLNNLQDVLVSSGQPAEVTRSRSPAGHDMQRAYSKSPKRNGVTSTRSYSSQRPRSRSRSPEKLGLRSRSDRLGSPIFPERDVPAS